ncbi:hypothetical protein ACHAWF_007411, partial [Thalassiosira exigua]
NLDLVARLVGRTTSSRFLAPRPSDLVDSPPTMKQSHADYLRSLDAHSPISSEFRIRTLSGALLSLSALVLVFRLILSEYRYNLATTFLDHVRVMPQSPDGLEVEFDVTFPHIPCALLATDANDPTGQSQSFHIDQRHRVWKHRLDENGNAVGRKSRFELGGTLIHEDQLDALKKAKEQDKANPSGGGADDGNKVSEHAAEGEEEADDEEFCGPCYGAGDEDECCNTCDDVKRAYRRKQWHVPDITKISQCVHLVRADAEEGEGCNVHGFVALSTGGGNLHFAPDRQWEKEGDATDKGRGPFGLNGFLDLNSVIEIFNEGGCLRVFAYLGALRARPFVSLVDLGILPRGWDVGNPGNFSWSRQYAWADLDCVVNILLGLDCLICQ